MKHTFQRLLDDILKWRVYALALTLLAASSLVFIATTGMTATWGKMVNAIAGGLIPSILVGVLWDLFLKRSFFNYVQNKLSSQLKNLQEKTNESIKDKLDAHTKSHAKFLGHLEELHAKTHSGIIGHLDGVCSCMNEVCRSRSKVEDFGVLDIYPDRSRANLGALLTTAKKRIWILVTSFSYLNETPGLMEMLTRQIPMVEEVLILGLAPNTESAKLRSAFSTTYTHLNEEIPIHIKRLTAKLPSNLELQQKLDVRLYDKIPTCACFLVDDRMLVCPLLCSRRGREGIHFLVGQHATTKGGKGLFAEYEQHLQSIREDPASCAIGTTHP